jgi:hypothetical protein
MRLSAIQFSAALLCVWSAHAAAEPAYVIDKLLVGIHETKDASSAIVKVVPTGTQLEVIKREGDAANVRESGGASGWVDAAYLSSELPARQRVTELEKSKLALEDKLKQLESAARGGAVVAPGAAAGLANAEIDTLTKENTELKGKLSDEKLRAETLQTEASSLRAQVKSTAVPPDARLVELERSRDELEQDLEDAQQKLGEYAARTSLDDTTALVPVVVREYAISIVLVALVLAALAFGGGMYVADLLNRRRHGGFRL